MRELVCKNCGAAGIQIRNSYAVCTYCDSKYLLTVEDFCADGTTKASSSLTLHKSDAIGISLDGDIEILLQKCRLNPKNARKYANLILDIDPDNEEALRYL